MSDGGFGFLSAEATFRANEEQDSVGGLEINIVKSFSRFVFPEDDPGGELFCLRQKLR